MFCKKFGDIMTISGFEMVYCFNIMKKNVLNKIMGSASKMAMATFTSRILGLVREQAMAAIFGASGITDAFNVAYRIPNMLRDLFAEGAFSPAFVPVFTEAKNKDFNTARRLLWSMFIVLLILTVFVCLLMIIFAPEIVATIAPRFASHAEKFEITVNLLRIMAPFLSLISIAALFMGALNTLKIFFVPAVAPAFFNIVMIVSIIFLPRWFESHGIRGVYALGFGVICGGLLQIIVQVPLIIRKNLGPMGPVNLISSHTKKIFARIGIGSIGIAANQINIFINTMLATGTVVGAVSWLNYAFRLFQFPLGILGVSIAGSNLVHFSDAWKAGRKEEAIGFLKSSYLLSLITIFWAMSMLFAMSGPTIHLIFERGAFKFTDTLMTTDVLRLYLLGLPFYSLYKIFGPTFYSLDKPKIPVIISVCSIIVNIVFCLTFVPIFGFKILALGVSLSITINALLQAVFLGKMLSLRPSFFLNFKVIKVILSGSVTCGIVFVLTEYFFDYNQSFLVKILIFVALGLFGIFVYGSLLALLGEWNNLKKVLGRFKK